MTVDWQRAAASNNAAWCDCVARSHGLATERRHGAWICRERLPPFYPNVVTLESTELPAALLAELSQALPGGFGVKDSYACLDLRQVGLAILFDAQWYCRPAGPMTGADPAERDRVNRVVSAAALADWVGAWGETPVGAQIFRPAILDDPAVSFLFVERESRIVAGLVANRSGAVTGISNAFGEPQALSSCIRAVAAGPEHPAIVGYGSGAELRALAPLGFAGVGRLRIWTRS